MKKILVIAFIFLLVKVEAQNMVISFTSSVSGEIIDSVLVENLFQNRSVVTKGTDNLELTASVVGISDYGKISQFKIFPNPVIDNCNIQFENATSGKVDLELYDLTGKQLTHQSKFLEQGIHTFQLSGLPAGISLLKVCSSTFNYTGKIISINKGSIDITSITYSCEIPNMLKSATSNDLMQYNEGETLKYTIYSGKNMSVMTDKPTASKTYGVAFYGCFDMDGRSYKTVTIGTQVWMAENLAYLPEITSTYRYSDTVPCYYVYFYEKVNLAEAKSNVNYKKYGTLYNWNAALNICPTGWHLPSDDEWRELNVYLDINGFNYTDATRSFCVAKSLASNYGWDNSNDIGDVGNDKPSNNRSGFSALPGGKIQNLQNYCYFSFIGETGYWWSSTKSEYTNKVIYLWLDHNYNSLNGSETTEGCFSVRCVKD